jgi:8-oxo-dGTP diphosphatase
MSAHPVHNVAVALVWRDHDLLMVRQAAADEEPYWALPGGLLEDGELVTEALVREVLEETGIEVVGVERLAFALQADSRRPARFRRASGTETGYLATVWTFDVGAWRGSVCARDPDGVVREAAFVPRDEAIARLERVWWLRAAAAFIRGEVVPGALVLQRWHADGQVEDLGRIAPSPPSYKL